MQELKRFHAFQFSKFSQVLCFRFAYSFAGANECNSSEKFDVWLAEFIDKLDEKDLLILTADHGNDPTTPSTNHSREYVPILCYGHLFKSGVNLGVRKSFADLQASLAEYFDVPKSEHGESFLPLINN